MTVFILKLFYSEMSDNKDSFYVAGVFYSLEAAEYAVKNSFPVGYINNGYEIEEFILGEVKHE
jgi:hypothetical protein